MNTSHVKAQNYYPMQDQTTKVLIIILMMVVFFAWTTMIWGTVKTYQEAPPIPKQFLSESNKIVMTADDIFLGKEGFQKAGLMDFGSLYGMGSYFGEDYTATYVVALGEEITKQLANNYYKKPLENLSAEQKYVVQDEMQSMLHNIKLQNEQVILPQVVADSIITLRDSIATSLLQHDPERGWTKAHSLTHEMALRTADFLLYSAITTVANRPDKDYSWTSNWPYEPSVANHPTTESFVWTWASLTILFLAIGLVLVIFKLYIEHDHLDERPEAMLSKFNVLTPSQIALGKYFITVSLLLLVQISAGVLLAHYYAERESFYGINLSEFIPFSFLRCIHLQTPIAWIGLGWIGTALFLAPIIGGREPKAQKLLVNLLFWVTVTIVVGALIGNYLCIMGYIDDLWFWFGNQGLSYIELGRFWQILFFVGLLSWSLIMLRCMWPALIGLIHWKSLYSLFRMEHLLWYSTLGIAFIYVFGMIPLTKIHASFTLTDYWRWWVVHLWVEWAFEIFASAVIGYFLMAVGLVSRQFAERAVIFEWILILGSGILGTGHHLYWAGASEIWLSLGSVFSFLEVLPILLLILEAIGQYIHIKRNDDFPYRLAFLYILGSAFWNYVGAGVFGGATINAPLVNYYEHGTFLTLNHAHTAMFGAFGLLALGLIYLALRYMAGNRIVWNDRIGIWAFWLYNLGMILWVALNFFPIGWAQLAAVYEHGYAYARSLEFYNQTLLWQWLRFPGDVVFAIAALLMAWDYSVKVLGILRKEANIKS